MIEWKKYDPENPPNREGHYLVTNGVWVTSGVLSVLPMSSYDWLGESGYLEGVTHYAEINLPE